MELQYVESHLKDCPRCARYHKELVQIHTALRASPELVPPDSFYEGVHHRIENPGKEPLPFWGPRMKVVSSLMAVLVVGLATWKVQDKVKEERRSFNAVVEAPPPQTQFPSTPSREYTMENKSKSRIAEESESSSLMNEAGKDKATLSYGTSPAYMPAPAVPSAASAIAKKQDTGLRSRIEPNQKMMGRKSGIRAKDIPYSVSGSLSDRMDVTLQARDVGGVATQGSFDGKNEKLLGKANPAGAKGLEVQVVSDQDPSLPSEFVEWRGSGTKIRKFRNVIVRSQSEMNSLWSRHAPGAPAPVIDFEKFMVVGIVLGPTHNRHTSVEVFGTREQATTAVVYYREMTLKEARTSSAAHIPYHFKVVPKTKLPIQFEKI